MSQLNSNIKDDFQVVLLLSCFVGHPVFQIMNSVKLTSLSLKYQRFIPSVNKDFKSCVFTKTQFLYIIYLFRKMFEGKIVCLKL